MTLHRCRQLQVPYRSTSDSLSTVALATAVLSDEEDRRTAQELTLHAVLAGDRSAGDLCDRLERMDIAERRALLEAMRSRAGYGSATPREAEELDFAEPQSGPALSGAASPPSRRRTVSTNERTEPR